METLRKFGLQYCDVPTMLWNISVLLRPVTLSIDPRYKNKTPFIFYIITIIISSCYFYVYVLSVFWFVFIKSMETHDIISATVVFALGNGSMVSTIKFIYMLIYHNTLRNLIGNFIEYQPLILPDSRASKNLLKTLKVVKRRAIYFWILIIGDGFIYAVKPILTPGRHLPENIEFLYGLQPMLESPNYEISYLVTVGGIIFPIYLTANITSFLIIVSGCVEAQMLALSQELTLLWEDAQKEIVTFEMDFEMENNACCTLPKNREKIVNAFVKDKLNDLVKKHILNINLIKQIDQVFQNSLCAEYLFLIISLIAELIAGLENTYVIIPFQLTLVTVGCFTGQKLIDSSVAFTAAVYDSKWENFDATNMKSVLIMLINSQKEMALSVGGFTTLSYICLMSVAQMIYSTYTTLRSTMK